MRNRSGRHVGVSVWFGAVFLALGMFAASIAAPSTFAASSSPGSINHAGSLRTFAAKTTPTTTTKTKRKKKTTTTTKHGGASSAASAQALLDTYCQGVGAGTNTDPLLFDAAMRPLLTRGLVADAVRTGDPSLAADAGALLNTVTASLSATSLAQVPAEIQAGVQAVRAEKQAILQHLVGVANGDASAWQFILDATNTLGGVQTEITSIDAFVQTNCPAADSAPATATTTR